MIEEPASSEAELNARFSDAFVAGLKALGVASVVLSPGSRNTPMTLAFARQSAIKVQVVLDERSAGFVALGLAKGGGRPVALLCTSGSAGGHYLPAVMEAHHSCVSLLVLTADRPPELQNTGSPQTTTQTGLFQNHCRLALSYGPASHGFEGPVLKQRLEQIGQALLGQPRGPVHVNLPFRKSLWRANARPPEDTVCDSWNPGLPRSEAWTELEVEALARRLAAEPRGLLSVGQVADAKDTAPWHELASLLGWPLLAEASSQLRMGFDDEQYAPLISTYDTLLRDSELAAQLAPSFVLRAGLTAPVSTPLMKWFGQTTSGKTLVLEDQQRFINPSRVDCEFRQAQVSALLPRVIEALKQRSLSTDEGWLESWRRAQSLADEIHQEFFLDEPLWEGAVARTVLECLPHGAALNVASSMPVRDVDAFSGCHSHSVTVFCSRGLNGIDGTLSTAAGIQRAWSAGPTAVLLGDLAFLHDIGALVQQVAALLIIVINNGGGGIFEFLPIAENTEYFEDYFITEPSSPLEDWVPALAPHCQVSDRESLKYALQDNLDRGGASVIEVMIDRHANVRIHRELNEAFQVRRSRGGSANV